MKGEMVTLDLTTDKQKLEAHVLEYPADFISYLLLKLYDRIEMLEAQVAEHQPVINRNMLIGG